MTQDPVVEASKPASPAQESPTQPLPEIQQQLVDVSRGGGGLGPLVNPPTPSFSPGCMGWKGPRNAFMGHQGSLLSHISSSSKSPVGRFCNLFAFAFFLKKKYPDFNT